MSDPYQDPQDVLEALIDDLENSEVENYDHCESQVEPSDSAEASVRIHMKDSRHTWELVIRKVPS